MTSIKDYIVVKNAIPEKVCKDIISNLEKDKPWEKHYWYDSVHNLKYTKKTILPVFFYLYFLLVVISSQKRSVVEQDLC